MEFANRRCHPIRCVGPSWTELPPIFAIVLRVLVDQLTSLEACYAFNLKLARM
jgi:hypothetical protein